tara:strand:- start:3101 stop:4915 length:1815 start_codon:yes stop_codon:yes gene_type:complete
MPENKDRKYLAKDFVGLRNELLNHAKIYFPNNIQDFSEASLGGLLLEMAAYVGDNMSYYLDHQFNELNYETAVEAENIENHLRNAGVKIIGASPATMVVKFYIEVPSELINGDYGPQPKSLPIIKKGTTVATETGINFELSHDIDFAAKDEFGEYVATIVSSNRRGGIPESFFMYSPGLCTSGQTTTETFAIPNTDKPFRTISLQNSSISSIDRVYDTAGNDYYEVESLSQDTVFKAVNNDNFANDGVFYNMQVISASRRFITETSLLTRSTSIKFGSGSPSSLDTDIIPDPSELALPLFGRRNVKKFSIDPNSILQSKTLGVYPKNTTIFVSYRYGGGSSHNVPANSANGVSSLSIEFDPSISGAARTRVINSIDVVNDEAASGGSDSPGIEELRALIPASRNMQNRIVTKQDLLARLFTLPAEFGRIFRASIIANPNNPLASMLHVISRNKEGKLTQAPDALKQNISTYLNEFRLISNAIDILDAEIINFKVTVNVVVTAGTNPTDVANSIIINLKEHFNINNFQLGQNLNEAKVISVILNTPGVQAMDSLLFGNISGNINDRNYSGYTYSFSNNRINGSYAIPANAIFELRYPEQDITVNV